MISIYLSLTFTLQYMQFTKLHRFLLALTALQENNLHMTSPTAHSDRVLIHNLQLDVLIGVYDFERLAPQRVIFEVDLHTDCRPAGLSDDVADAVNYAQVTEVITRISCASEYQLLEALAEDVATQILDQFGTVACIDLTLHKPDIMPNDVKVAITISRSRAQVC